jgi:hypothetical protein
MATKNPNDVHVHVHVHREKTSAKKFAVGGTDHMLGPQKADVKTRSQTGPTDARGPGKQFPGGGTKGLANLYSPSRTAPAGRTAPTGKKPGK